MVRPDQERLTPFLARAFKRILCNKLYKEKVFGNLPVKASA
jgi:hypothetical protein